MLKTVEMDLEYIEYIPKAPIAREDLYGNAIRNDKVTIDSWKETWIDNAKKNSAKYGPFAERSIAKIYGKYALRPAICEGSGPSLRNNIDLLKDRKGIPLISCLHNFHYNVDHDVHPEFYVSLDAGDITLREVSKGGAKDESWYLDKTKDYTLLAYIGSSPKLLEAWQGEILFFSCPLPDVEVFNAIMAVDPLYTFVSSGGNVLGACVYLAKAYLGCNPITFVGADFSFDYKKNFHPWDDANYKRLGNVVRLTDVFGHKVFSWQSYVNFKNFFEWMAMTIPGIYINCSEGGALGSYPQGNIQDIIQMDLKRFINMYSMYLEIKEQAENPEKESKVILY